MRGSPKRLNVVMHSVEQDILVIRAEAVGLHIEKRLASEPSRLRHPLLHGLHGLHGLHRLHRWQPWHRSPFFATSIASRSLRIKSVSATIARTPGRSRFAARRCFDGKQLT